MMMDLLSLSDGGQRYKSAWAEQIEQQIAAHYCEKNKPRNLPNTSLDSVVCTAAKR